MNKTNAVIIEVGYVHRELKQLSLRLHSYTCTTKQSLHNILTTKRASDFTNY